MNNQFKQLTFNQPFPENILAKIRDYYSTQKLEEEEEKVE